ncbi:Os08g0194666 [Oryza sativa Japonica Group]|uniref:Os08g0194666 protein n=1 Tax=Oryza sativa subsp. japonica TaxID=39947 RepID=C7J6D9_ORYSJ|nr:Os08g0194666 [Oryza sativa Japonica Group]|eukprot:NP_001175420.1 Os08g0194666 [Oryza sativa Japonica Group]
MRAGSVVSN